MRISPILCHKVACPLFFNKNNPTYCAIEKISAFTAVMMSTAMGFWWASHQVGVHAEIQNHILFELERRKKETTPEVRRAWRYIFEAWKTRKNDFHDWYRLKASIDIDGWSDAAIRELVSIWQPFLKVEWPYNSGPKPPECLNGVGFRQMVNLDVTYPEFHEQIDIPDEYLVTAIRAFRKNLEIAASLEKEQGVYNFLNLAPIEPDSDLEGESSDRHYGISHTFLFYVDLLKRLIIQNPGAAKQEYLAWWTDDDQIFARLRIWASGRQDLLAGSEAGHLLCSLNDGVFWDSHHARDLLLALGQRWSNSPVVGEVSNLPPAFQLRNILLMYLF